MRVLVCGGRDYSDRYVVFSTLDRIHDEETMPIRLRPMTTTASVLPRSRINAVVSRANVPACDSEQRTESVERVEPAIKSKRKFVQIGL